MVKASVWLCFVVACLVTLASCENPSTSGGSLCEFTFFPKQVRTPVGNTQMTVALLGNVELRTADDPFANRVSYKYKFTARILKAINPRLCRFLMVRNDIPELYFAPTSIDRVPLLKEYGLPHVKCMLNPTTVGNTVSSFPTFGRAGALIPPGDGSRNHPLCGDMFYFRQSQLLQFHGEVQYGTIRVLECQSGDPQYANDWKMEAMFMANCTAPPPHRGYPEGGMPPSQQQGATQQT